MKKTTIFIYSVLLITLSLTLFAEKKYNVNIANIPNGSYLGSYKYGNYGYDAVVQVENGKLVSIRLLNIPNKNVEKKSTTSFQAMIKENNIDADGVTGATWKIVVNDALTKLNKYK